MQDWQQVQVVLNNGEDVIKSQDFNKLVRKSEFDFKAKVGEIFYLLFAFYLLILTLIHKNAYGVFGINNS